MQTKCYYFDISPLFEEVLFDRSLALIPWEERKRVIEKYCFLKDKCLSLGTGLLLRYALHKSGITDLRLSYGAYGKPMLMHNPSGVWFNCSHSETMVVCAVSSSLVGVDIEKLSTEHKEVASYFFTPEELRWINTNPEGYYRLWTRKESYMKLLGTGITLDPKSIGVQDGAPLTKRYHFTEFSLPGYRLTVCGEACAPPTEININELFTC